ncbi:MAG: S8 family serine peptidase, partial [Bacillota bacterium]
MLNLSKKFYLLMLILLLLSVFSGCDRIKSVWTDSFSLSGEIEFEHSFVDSQKENLSSQSENDLSVQQVESQMEEKELIIGFKESSSAEKRKEIINNLGYKKIKEIKALDAVLVELPEIDVAEASIKASKYKEVDYAEPNYRVYPTGGSVNPPDDPEYENQWHYPLINLPRAWSTNTGDSNTGDEIRVAVLDTGVDHNHPDFNKSQIDLENAYNSSDESSEDSENV